MEHKCILGVEFRALANMLRRMIEQDPAFREISEVTPMQVAVIEYLYENRERDVFQRDLEGEFKIRRSTVTGILQGMERRGLVERLAVEQDARLKKLALTEYAYGLHCQLERSAQEIEKLALTGISEEEREFFFHILERMKENLT